mgnify:CR=1 FL=1
MTYTIPHYIKSNAKNYSKDIALREKKFGVWKTKDWQQCLEEIENITLGLHAKGITGKKTIAILGNNTPRWTLAEIAVQSLNLPKNSEVIIPNFTIFSNAIACLKNDLKN